MMQDSHVKYNKVLEMLRSKDKEIKSLGVRLGMNILPGPNSRYINGRMNLKWFIKIHVVDDASRDWIASVLIGEFTKHQEKPPK